MNPYRENVSLFELSYDKKGQAKGCLIWAGIVMFFVLFFNGMILFKFHDTLGSKHYTVFVISGVIILLILKVIHGQFTYRAFIGIDQDNTVHIPFDRLSFSRWRLPPNSVKASYGVKVDDNEYTTGEVRFCFGTENIIEIERVKSFEADKVHGYTGYSLIQKQKEKSIPNREMTEDLVRQVQYFYSSKGYRPRVHTCANVFTSDKGGVRILLKELQPLSYGERADKNTPIEDLWDKDYFRNIEIFLALEDPDEFIRVLKKRKEKRI